jgi:putative tricarboxylic transport membrane protein
MSEVTSFLESGDLKVLAVLAEKRLPAPYAEIQTAKEQGINVVAPNWRGFYMPAGVSEDERQYWINNLNAVYESDYWKDIMKKNALSPFNISGPQLDEFLTHQIGEIRSIFEILR